MPLPGPSREQRASRPRVERDEAELVRRAQLGSVAAFEQLVLKRGPDLYRYLVVRLRNDGDALDALQETLTAAWQGLPQLKTADRFWPWLCGIAAHKAADMMRRRTRMSGGDPEPRTLDDGIALEVREVIAALPEPYQEVLLLRHLLGLSEDEVAGALGLRAGTVKSRGARARKAFKELWE